MISLDLIKSSEDRKAEKEKKGARCEKKVYHMVLDGSIWFLLVPIVSF